MDWVLYAIAGALLSSIWSISIKRGINTVIPTDFSSAYTVISLILISIVNKIHQVPFTLNGFGLLAGVCQGISAILLTKSFTTTPNPGLTMGTFRSQAVVSAILAYFIFGSNLTASKVVAMIIVCVGIFIIGKSERTVAVTEPLINGTRKTKLAHTKEVANNSTRSNPNPWLIMALLAGLVMSFKDIFTKFGLTSSNSNTYNILYNVILANAVIIVIYDRITTGTFRLHDHDGDNNVTWKDYLIIVWTAVISAGYALTVISSTKTAPNVGYTKSIETLGVIVTTVLSKLIFNSDLKKDSLGGIALITGGVLYLSMT